MTKHARIRCPQEGKRVTFAPNPAAALFYTGPSGRGPVHSPAPGEEGTVTTIPGPMGRKTCMDGPRGGLVYVRWDESGVQGVFRNDLSVGGKSIAILNGVRPARRLRAKAKRGKR